MLSKLSQYFVILYLFKFLNVALLDKEKSPIVIL